MLKSPIPNLLGLIRHEAESIEHDQERRTFMEQDGRAHSQSKYRRGNKECDHTEAEPEILPNNAASLSAQADGEGEVV